MTLNILRKSIILLLPFIFLAESPAFFSQENISNPQSKKTVLLTAQNTQRSTSSTRTTRQDRAPVRKTGTIKPQYENCKGKDIYKLNSGFQDTALQKKTEAKGPCLDCAAASSTGPRVGSFDDIAQTLQAENEQVSVSVDSNVGSRTRTRTNISTNSNGNGKTKKSSYQAFKDQLRKRVLGQVKTKIARTQILQKCTQIEEENIEKHRSWFTKRFPKVDWPLMKALCEKKKKDFHSSIKTSWPDMRVSMALTSINPDQVVTSHPNLSFSLSHEVSDFGSISKLTPEEQQQAKERWSEHLSKAPLDKLSPEQLKSQFMEGRALRQASTKDIREMRRATRDLQKKSRDRYRKIVEEMPLLGYMKTGDPENREDRDQAFSKYMGHLDDLLKKVEGKDVDMALLLRFGPLVEGLLKDNAGYCLTAEGERLKAERDESLKMWGLVTAGVVAAGVVAAIPCFMTSGAVCLGLGALVGAVGYTEAKEVLKESLERFLTGKEFETLASLSEKNKAVFWELVLLPTAAWGTTAGTAQTLKQLLKKGASAGKQASAKAGNETSIANIKDILKTQKDRLLSAYDSILGPRPPAERNVIMEAILGMERSGLKRQTISI